MAFWARAPWLRLIASLRDAMAMDIVARRAEMGRMEVMRCCGQDEGLDEERPSILPRGWSRDAGQPQHANGHRCF